MNRTFVITVPDRIGTLEKLSRCCSANGVNVTGISYNRAVDEQKLFLTAEGTQAELDAVSEVLHREGFYQEELTQRPLLLELQMPDRPGTLWNISQLLMRENVEATYLNCHRDTDAEQQVLKLGCRPKDAAQAARLQESLSLLGEVKALAIDPTEQVLDNRGFYIVFAEDMQEMLGLPDREREPLMVWANLITQHLDERGEQPYATFEKVREFASFVVAHRADGKAGFHAIIEWQQLTPRVRALTIQPPCGSNTVVLVSEDALFLVDGGYCCNTGVTLDLIRREIPQWDQLEKTMFLTHADADHIGLAKYCDRILVNRDIYENFVLEAQDLDDWREQTSLGRAYMRLNKVFSAYEKIPPERLTIIGEKTDDTPLSTIGSLDFEDLHFEVLQGNGGHVRGESVLLEHEKHIAFTGDNIVNIKGFSPEQAEFNRLAPFLMNSVNVDSAKATIIRKLLTAKTMGWRIFPGHGAPYISS